LGGGETAAAGYHRRGLTRERWLSGTIYRRKAEVERAEGAGREPQVYEVELKFSVPDMRAIE
jgi:hypothetical protein